MKKILVMLALTASFLAAINVQKASKDELICIKGIGEKKASSVLQYRKTHKLKSADDLLEIKGFGKVLVNNVQKNILSAACKGKSSNKSSKNDSKEDVKKESKKESKKLDVKDDSDEDSEN